MIDADSPGQCLDILGRQQEQAFSAVLNQVRLDEKKFDAGGRVARHPKVFDQLFRTY